MVSTSGLYRLFIYLFFFKSEKKNLNVSIPKSITLVILGEKIPFVVKTTVLPFQNAQAFSHKGSGRALTQIFLYFLVILLENLNLPA